MSLLCLVFPLLSLLWALQGCCVLFTEVYFTPNPDCSIRSHLQAQVLLKLRYSLKERVPGRGCLGNRFEPAHLEGPRHYPRRLEIHHHLQILFWGELVGQWPPEPNLLPSRCSRLTWGWRDMLGSNMAEVERAYPRERTRFPAPMSNGLK